MPTESAKQALSILRDGSQFYVSFWVFDMESIRKKIATVGVIFSVDLIALVLFGVMLKWI